jgi:hypothetical protein
MSVDTAAFTVHKTSNGAAVFGSSRGSDGAAGGNALIPGNAGNGGVGADGGTVVVSFDGAIITTNSNSTGIVARSLAGDGGTGGVAYVAGPSGNGGAGGFGGNASATLQSGSIETSGTGSIGVLAFSQGGNAGVGGAGGIIASPGTSGHAGQAGAAIVSTAAGTTIVTHGNSAYGIGARSIGGGGGTGASDSGIFYSAGTNGSTGGAGGTVTVNSFGNITTYGEGAHGIYAQSMGGGGGDAGISSSSVVAIGATGGIGGVGGQVDVTNAGAITTHGLRSNAIEAQSIGGGGGNGGAANGAITMGGDGGGATAGGAVTVTNTGTLSTDYGQSAGLFAHSVGGGGGNGTVVSGTFYRAGGSGGAGSNGNTVTVTNAGDIFTGQFVPGLVTDFNSLVIEPQNFSLFLQPTQSIDDSPGILAQSIGGGGGVGAGSMSSTATGLSINYGGTGGAAGDGGVVRVNRDNSDWTLATPYTIHTFAQRSGAVVAQSLGGGGGLGGFSVTLTSNGIFGAGWGSAGHGGAGGDGGDVFVETKGWLFTDGAISPGILAASIGGGGGAGGYFISGAAGIAGVTVAIGADGGDGGNGAKVDVSNRSHITTAGLSSPGINAASIGGGGGDGGFAISASAGLGAVSVGVGGTGGGGGSADDVKVNSIGDITTQGDRSAGIRARSIGGGGGDGGFSVTAGVGAGSVTVGVGGSGGVGNSAGDVEVTSVGRISTSGSSSPGITAKSLGGGGGDGGFNVSVSAAAALAVSVGVGGSGGAGSTAGAVTITSLGVPGLVEPGHLGTWTIITRGNSSFGIAGVSTGGGGGDAGFSISVAGSATIEGVGGSVGVSVGGAGGKASHASTVDITSTGSILTLGDYAHGITAQSTGGGGGNGGFSIGAGVTMGQVGVGVSVGGRGDGGGNGDDVTVNAYARTDASGTTFLLDSAPIGTVTLQTAGYQASAIFAQSVGGGGGNGGFSIGLGGALAGAGAGVSVGGFGKGGGTAGVVTVTSYHNISTGGDEAPGISAQSLGGGGGNGGFSIGLGAGSQFIATGVSVGGSGDKGGNGDDVTVKNYGTIATSGQSSPGILAQSIGGGGGNGRFSIGGGLAGVDAIGVGVSVGGSGGGAGNGRAVLVEAYAIASGGVASLIAPSVFPTLHTTGDYSDGISAASRGGGGGNGAFSVGGALSTGVVPAVFSFGGTGDGGGNGWTATVTSVHNIQTGGNFSNGIYASSLGGGGGKGGFSAGLSAGSQFAGQLNIGGDGALGGNATTVTVNHTGTILTAGVESAGIRAESIGGGGGNGGMAMSGTFAMQNGTLGASIGGFGGMGGIGGPVIVNSNAGTQPVSYTTITTTGNGAEGIIAQSLGGGGGNGGIAGTLSVAVAAKGTVSLSMGGFGGTGQIAGGVTINSVDNISTTGIGAEGILAQSQGGGGGTGGISIAGTIEVPDGNDFVLDASLGGFGGSGGNGGQIVVNSIGNILTTGRSANGILAMSVGGGGGKGGLSVAANIGLCATCTSTVPTFSTSVGGFGGPGGTGNSVHVTHVGSITVTGDRATGLRALSLGGGGGDGALSIAGSVSGFDAKQATASVGGFGGAGSEAGNVFVDNTGLITTGSVSTRTAQIAEVGEIFAPFVVREGFESSGIVARSVGGGGGDGGLSISGAIGGIGANTNLAVGITVGGFGGSGGFAGRVDVFNNGLITTYGHNAHGIFAQSIGGGGGNGGGAITGLLAGGNPTTARPIEVSVAVGGKGGDGNVGGKVFIDQTGGIQTYGNAAHGILAQSVGGGGGTGGSANSIALMIGVGCFFNPGGLGHAIVERCNSVPNGMDGVKVQFVLGGTGGIGNDADEVHVINSDFITTHGDDSWAIAAQSIGGGGGDGGHSMVGFDGILPKLVSLGSSLLLLPVGVGGLKQSIGLLAIGGSGGAGGDGKKVTLDNGGLITTLGVGAGGLGAQSVGGGGGNAGSAGAGFTGTLGIGGAGGAAGNGGDVEVNNLVGGNVQITSAFAPAIFAQSVGGGGGRGGAGGGLVAIGGLSHAAGNGGAVDVSNNAHIQTNAGASVGIQAESIGGGGGDGGGVGLTAITIGGSGGAAGDGSTVDVHNRVFGTILTFGNQSHGIVAMSQGGGGGTGGSNGPAVITIGGWGDAGGTGGTVTVGNKGTIETHGDDAMGIFAQSLGGGGGLGGSSFVSLVAIGGASGASGEGGHVDITNTGTIVTYGHGSHAVMATSIGGGGGVIVGDTDWQGVVREGLQGSLFTIGGSGVSGAGGGTIDVTNSGLLHTVGVNANAIDAQSIGGGGGEAGRVSGAFAIGGRGGSSGNGQAINITNEATGSIWTEGNGSNGIFAQSLGGGGGKGGNTDSFFPVLLAVSLGATGGGGGTGGHLFVENFGTIQTDGSGSQAIFAQSVGGGGGVGSTAGSSVPPVVGVALAIGGAGGAGGNGGIVRVFNRSSGTIYVNGDDSIAILAQSVGGGGGTGGVGSSDGLGILLAIPIGIGGRGGAAGSGVTVSVTNEGLIYVNGDNSVGIVAQSVGGGGGVGALREGGFQIAFGGSEGANGDGGFVTVTNTGTIFLNGKNSIGIFAQSLGGGGGMVLPGSGAMGLTEMSGSAGDGHKVTIDNGAANVVSMGDGSIALFAQSVGGGGGFAGSASDPLFFAGSTGGAGSAGPTVVNQTGNLLATGKNSSGLVVQSDARDGRGDVTINILNAAPDKMSVIGGGSGTGAGVAILGGAHNQLNNAGLISTVLGIKGTAIRATVGDDRVENTGTIVGSVDLGGGQNAFVNAIKASFMAGDQVMLGTGNTLTNRGTLWAGDPSRVSTTALTGDFAQSTDGVFAVDLDLRFGAADRLNVSGTASVDGTIKVNLINPLASAIAAKPGTFDAVIVAAAGGQLGAAVGVQAAPPLSLQASTTAVLTYSLEHPASTDLVLRHTIDFAPAGLTANSRAVGQAINAIQTAQASSAFAPVAGATFYQPDLPALEKTYASLSGSAVAGLEGLSFSSTDGFMLAIGRQTQMWLGNRAIDVNGDVGAPRNLTSSSLSISSTASRTLAPGAASGRWRSWFGRDGRSTTVPGNDAVGSVDSRQQGYVVSGGVDYQPTRDLLLGVAGGSGTQTFEASLGDARGSARTNYGAGYVAWAAKNYYVTGAVAVSHQTNEMARLAEIPMTALPAEAGGAQIGGAEALSGRSRGWGIGTSVEGGYMHAFGWFAVGPFAGIQATTLRTAAYVETNHAGASLLGLNFGSRDVWSTPAFAGLQVRTESALSRSVSVSIFGRATWIRELTPLRTLDAEFVSAPGTSFIVRGAEPVSDARRALLGVQVVVGRLGVFAEGNADFLHGGAMYSGAAGLRVRW